MTDTEKMDKMFNKMFDEMLNEYCRNVAHEQTNEEWLKGLDAEQLAHIIAMQKCDGCNDEPYDAAYAVCRYCMDEKRKRVMEWLKKKHT